MWVNFNKCIMFGTKYINIKIITYCSLAVSRHQLAQRCVFLNFEVNNTAILASYFKINVLIGLRIVIINNVEREVSIMPLLNRFIIFNVLRPKEMTASMNKQSVQITHFLFFGHIGNFKREFDAPETSYDKEPIGSSGVAFIEGKQLCIFLKFCCF